MSHPQPNQLSNQPMDYMSIRVTLDNNMWDRIADVFRDVEFIAYPHKGQRTKKEHFHVLVLDKSMEKFRKRLRDAGFKGNGMVSMKMFDNGLLRGIQYASKEETQPTMSSSSMQEFIDAAPAWVHDQRLLPFMSEKPEKLRDWQLTYSNLVVQAVNHAQKKGLTGSLKYVVADMIASTKWRPAKNMVTSGVPEFYEHDFEFRCGRRAEPDMAWWTPRF